MAGSSECMGLMAVVAVSSGVALVALRLQKRLTSEFVKEVELLSINSSAAGIGGGKEIIKDKKRVRFAADVVEPSSNNKEYRRRRIGVRGRPMCSTAGPELIRMTSTSH